MFVGKQVKDCWKIVFPLLIFSPILIPQFLYFFPSSHFSPLWIMKCYVDIQLSMKVSHILTEKITLPLFSFLLFPFPFFHSFPPPSHSILQNIYPCLHKKQNSNYRNLFPLVGLPGAMALPARVLVPCSASTAPPRIGFSSENTVQHLSPCRGSCSIAYVAYFFFPTKRQ